MVATPIGHLSDITIRAVEVLKSVQTIAAEDTRHSRVLLDHIQAHPERLIPLHDHNEGTASMRILEILEQGNDVAVISDAGTPLLSDPGFRLVRRVRNEGFPVVPVPGCSAVMAALSVSSVPVERFYFQGFLPSKPIQRRALLKDLCEIDCAVIFYEAPHRIGQTFEDLAEMVAPERQILVARELTKMHETIEVDSVQNLAEQFASETPRGEYVCILEGHSGAVREMNEDTKKLLKILSEELSTTQSARLAARITGLSKSTLYDYLVRRKESSA